MKPVGKPDDLKWARRFDERGWETEGAVAPVLAPILDSTGFPEERGMDAGSGNLKRSLHDSNHDKRSGVDKAHFLRRTN